MLRDAQEEWRAGEPNIEEELWSRLKSGKCFYLKGAEVSMTRFTGSSTKSAQEDKGLHMRLYGLISVCLEMGVLARGEIQTARAASKRAREKHAQALDPERAKKETMRETTERELKAIRQASSSAIHLSLMMYSDIRNQDRQRMVVWVSEPVILFHQRANIALDVDTSSQWLVDMCSDGVFSHCNEIAQRLVDIERYNMLGLDLGSELDSADISDGGVLELLEVDEKASEMMCFGLALLAARLKRNLGFLGSWPLRSCLWASASSDVRDAALQELKDKFDRYKRIRAQNIVACRRLLLSSMFGTTPLLQYTEWLDLTGWQLSPSLAAHAVANSKRLATSQLCEDGFNRCKRATASGANHLISNQRSYFTVLDKKVIDGVHRYRAPDVSACVVPRGASLPPRFFQGAQKETLEVFKQVKGFGDPKLYSPGANQFGEHVAHEEVLRIAEERGHLRRASESWKSCLLNSQGLVVKEKTATQWLFVLGQASSDAYFGWPADLQQVGSDGALCFSLGTTASSLHILVILDEADWEGFFCEWPSPASQKANFGVVGVPARAFPDRTGLARPLLEVAASRPLFAWTRTSLIRWAAQLKVELAPESDMFTIVSTLVKVVVCVCRRRGGHRYLPVENAADESYERLPQGAS